MDAQRDSKRTETKPLDAVFFVIPMGLAFAYWLVSFAA
jgi:hypothetical protein